ncbi:hypothetical protein D3C87_2197200 [compost metagenome]
MEGTAKNEDECSLKTLIISEIISLFSINDKADGGRSNRSIPIRSHTARNARNATKRITAP